MNQSKIENGQPEEKPNNEQTADNQQVSPSIANANVVGSLVGQREIKFRLHDKRGAIIGYETHVRNIFGCYQIYQTSLRNDWNDGNENKLVRDGYFIAATYKVQYTRSKDKNSMEIYESDINQDGGVVIWNDDDASFCWHYENIETQPFGEEKEWCEIKGNIFENPELLETLR